MGLPADKLLEDYTPGEKMAYTYNSGYQAAVADMREAIKRYGDLPFEFEGKMYYITDDPLWQKMKADLMQVAEALLEDKS